ARSQKDAVRHAATATGHQFGAGFHAAAFTVPSHLGPAGSISFRPHAFGYARRPPRSGGVAGGDQETRNPTRNRDRSPRETVSGGPSHTTRHATSLREVVASAD